MKYYENMFAIAKGNLERDKHLSPIIFVETENRQIVICGFASMPSDDSAKRKAFFSLGTKMAQEKIVINSIFFVCEGWYACPKKGEPIKLPVRENPDRKEAVVGSYYSKDGVKIMYMTPFIKNADKTIVWENQITMEEKDKNKLDFFLLDGFWAGYAVGKSLNEQKDMKGGGENEK